MSDQDIQQLSLIEQNLSATTNQKQSFQKQILEIDNALEELQDRKEGYHIVGTLMIKKPAKDIKADLEKKKKMYELRLSSLEKQEETLKKQAKELQEQVVARLDKEKK